MESFDVIKYLSLERSRRGREEGHCQVDLHDRQTVKMRGRTHEHLTQQQVKILIFN